MSDDLQLDARTHLLVMTGAGISAESGIPTFRGRGRDERLDEDERELLSTPEMLHATPTEFWRGFSERRRQVLEAAPNAGHRALVQLEKRLGERFLLVTQNIDGLHALAGSQRLVEIHGCLFRTRCTRCRRPAFADIRQLEIPPRCELCLAAGRGDARDPPLLRPDVVLFGEALASGGLSKVKAFVETGARERLVYLAVGTSGTVYPAAELVRDVRRAGGESWLVNLERSANAEAFDHVLLGPSGELLPKLLET